jgi:tetratricopeptide (TPR) repeat protein
VRKQCSKSLPSGSSKRGNLEGAIRAYREALKIDPQLTGVHFELGEALLRRGGSDLSEAQKEFEAAIAENPNDAESEYHLGEISLRNSDKNAAYEHFSRAFANTTPESGRPLRDGKAGSVVRKAGRGFGRT